MRETYYDGPNYHALTALMRSRITYGVMICLGLLLGVGWVSEDQYLREAPEKFRKAPCVVQDSDVEVHSMGRYGVATSFAPVVTFSFTAADGRDYTVTGYRLHEDGMSMVAAGEIADRYEPGQEAACYYDPTDPSRAVLSLDSDRQSLGWMFLASLLLLLGGLAGLFFLEFVLKRAERRPVLTPEVLSAALEPPPPLAAPADAVQAGPPAAERGHGFRTRD